MTSTIILLLAVSLLVLEFLFSWFLSVLNLNSIIQNRAVIPDAFTQAIDHKDYANSIRYSLVKGRFSLVSQFWSFLFLLIIIFSNFPGHLEQFMLGYIPQGKIFSILYIYVFSFLYSLSSLPFSLYSQFVIEEEFGFNKTSLKLFLSDSLKQFIITPVLVFPLLWGLFYFMEQAGNVWWVFASAFIIIFQLFLLLIYPVFIAPIFNKFTPLEEGSLKSRLLKLAEKTGFNTKGIFVMDGSRRSGHSNAYFTGFGKFRRIVLFDTLIQSLTEEELEAVLAHEIGHNKLKHIPKSLIFSTLMLTGALFITSLCLHWNNLFIAFGYTGPGYHSILIILMICSSPLTFFFSPLSNHWSRKHEYEADEYACQRIGNSTSLSDALLRLSKDNLSNLTPHRLYSTFHYSHPALSERLDAMRKITDHMP